MSDARSTATGKFLTIVGVLTFVAVAATLGFSFLVAPSPRSFTANVATGFVCMVETVVGLLVAGAAARRRGAGPGGAATPVLVAVTVLYAVVGFLTIGVYAIAHSAKSGGEWLWAALIVETAVAFIAAGAFWGGAELVAAAEAPALARRAGHADLARHVREAATRLRGLSTRDPDEMKKIDSLVKRLSLVESALSHSTGGGVGSKEGGGSPSSDPAAEEELVSAAQALAADASSLAPGAQNAASLDRIAAGADRLRSAVDRLGLA